MTYLQIAANNNRIGLMSQMVHIINTNHIYLVVNVYTFHVLPVALNYINELIHSGILTKEQLKQISFANVKPFLGSMPCNRYK